MADIFISYAQADRKRVEPIVAALRAEGFEVWWDTGVMAGTPWRREIEAQLHLAKAVVPLWSLSAVKSDWVIEEAAYGKRVGRLCPARLDKVSPPIGFTSIQAANLIGWRGSRGSAAWKHFVESLRTAIDAEPTVALQPRRALPFRPVVLASAAVVVLAVGAWATQPWSGLPLRGTPEQRVQWRAVEAKHDCKALRAFVAEHRTSPFAADASDRLARARIVSSLAWSAKTELLPVTGVSTDESGRGAACRSAATAAKQSATENCALFFRTADLIRAKRVSIGDESCDCKEALGHWQCTINTRAQCAWEVQERVAQAVCS
ncbi:hypothetical protein BH10PSE4_BH10PSE4_16530 [soil metagenome]